MKRKFPNLSKPIQIGNVNFRNRMFSAPMGGTDITADCTIGRASTAFYELRAKGGAGAVTVSELVVHPKTEGSHMFHLDLQTVGALSSFTYTADAIRRHGSIASVELSHSGQFAGTYLTDKNKKQGLAQWGPSEGLRSDGLPVKALTQELIDEIVAAYGDCAALAKRAGFEMIMVHGGHGWLVNQFLSPFFNRRTDKYGGSLENRVRFAQEVLDSVRKAVGPGFPIEFRMSGSEFFDSGYDLAEGVEIAKLLESRVDLLHISAGTYQQGFSITHPSMFESHGRNVFLAAEIKKHVSVPVATIGGLNDPEMMEEIIASGKADVIYMARALLADPELPRKVMSNRDEDIIYCLRCFTCMAERAVTSTRRCTVNPLIGRELDGTEVIPTSLPVKVLVAGGGPGGLKAAITAAKRGHEVILCEKEDQLGGILKSEQAIPFKYEMYQLGVTLEKMARDAGVDIRLNTEVTKEYVENENVDALIIAVGSEPLLPPIPGLDGENVIVVNNYYLEKEKVTDEVIVLGGGLAGCEAAIHLAQEGKTVHLVEMREELAIDANIRHRPILLKEIEKQKIQVHTGLKGLRVIADGVICADSTAEEQLIPGTTVICALGQKARRNVVENLIDCAPYVAQIGDCVKASTITTAVYQGYHAALDI
ncbi:2,4-dienoyl-CoA reductase-like NADH-dependent reductase (Old Yellow Enzyme family) [Alkalibaculum bacchi]|uniref:2,4-dienoyl-CoA reductase-like NADH-dependent reductase (Old Yellow Enzyme family) n=1 Tax=Alkalibaculum bacchi TaxID=645887 RepID=A0A366HW51_9FIRM|nr:FAD-dependent oxidoreductase [Alkalibaculum bacchi]RBP57392.1 2,4-dienoyl-CoA reductase-like NADH-dependent reductase (Old Yellow Enzyme family) [Alkalibaculum bacchi]